MILLFVYRNLNDATESKIAPMVPMKYAILQGEVRNHIYLCIISYDSVIGKRSIKKEDMRSAKSMNGPMKNGMFGGGYNKMKGKKMEGILKKSHYKFLIKLYDGLVNNNTDQFDFLPKPFLDKLKETAGSMESLGQQKLKKEMGFNFVLPWEIAITEMIKNDTTQ